MAVRSQGSCGSLILIMYIFIFLRHEKQTLPDHATQVAYHGVPDKAYEVFVNALRSRYLQQRLIIPDLEDRNPAGLYFIGTS